MNSTTICAPQVTPLASAKHALVCIAAALLMAFALGTLMSSDWTLPVEPAVSATFTA